VGGKGFDQGHKATRVIIGLKLTWQLNRTEVNQAIAQGTSNQSGPAFGRSWQDHPPSASKRRPTEEAVAPLPKLDPTIRAQQNLVAHQGGRR